jgi:hypothetical protein
MPSGQSRPDFALFSSLWCAASPHNTIFANSPTAVVKSHPRHFAEQSNATVPVHRPTSIARSGSVQQARAICPKKVDAKTRAILVDPPHPKKESHLPDELCVLQQVAYAPRLNLGLDHSQFLRSADG